MTTIVDPLGQQRREQMFPALSPAQITRIAPLGARLVLRDPTVEQVADCLGLDAAIDVGAAR